MSYPVYYVPSGDVLPIMFDTFDGGTGASVTMTGLAVTDIEIYKDGGVTQRASDAGYTLLDTDGIDFDTITGIHGFSIDTGDNTDAGFYTVGAWFHVVVSAITVDAQTVNFIAAAFRLMPAEGVAGKPKVDVDTWNGTAVATPTTAGVPEVDITHLSGTDLTADGPIPHLGIIDQGTAQSATATTVVLRAASAFGDNTLIGATIMVHGSTQGYWQSRSITDHVLATDTVTVDTFDVTPTGTITYKIFAGAPASATNVPAVNVTQFGGVAGTFSGGRPEVNTTHVGGTAQTANDNGADINAILADTNELQTDITNGGRVDLLVDAIKAKTDSLTFTVAGQVDSNVQSINDVTITGNGQTGTEFGV